MSWLKRFLATPVRNILIWLGLLLFLYLIYAIGFNYARSGMPFWEHIFKTRQVEWIWPGITLPRPVRQTPRFVNEYTIQMGAFRSEAEAQTLQLQLMDDRINSRIHVERGVCFVLVGRFATEEQAKQMLKKIRAKKGRKAHDGEIIPPRGGPS